MGYFDRIEKERYGEKAIIDKISNDIAIKKAQEMFYNSKLKKEEEEKRLEEIKKAAEDGFNAGILSRNNIDKSILENNYKNLSNSFNNNNDLLSIQYLERQRKNDLLNNSGLGGKNIKENISEDIANEYVNKLDNMDKDEAIKKFNMLPPEMQYKIAEIKKKQYNENNNEQATNKLSGNAVSRINSPITKTANDILIDTNSKINNIM
jgi:hypothetical protein